VAHLRASGLVAAVGPAQIGSLVGSPLLAPPRRRQLLLLAATLLRRQWRVVSTRPQELLVLLRLLHHGLSSPADPPSFRTCLAALAEVQPRLAAQPSPAGAAADATPEAPPSLAPT